MVGEGRGLSQILCRAFSNVVGWIWWPPTVETREFQATLHRKRIYWKVQKLDSKSCKFAKSTLYFHQYQCQPCDHHRKEFSSVPGSYSINHTKTCIKTNIPAQVKSRNPKINEIKADSSFTTKAFPTKNETSQKSDKCHKKPSGGSLLKGLKHFIHNLLVGHDLFQENSKIFRRKRREFIVNFTQNRMNKSETTRGCVYQSSAFLEKIGFGRHFPVFSVLFLLHQNL